jgi:hypothetical protein
MLKANPLRAHLPRPSAPEASLLLKGKILFSLDLLHKDKREERKSTAQAYKLGDL